MQFFILFITGVFVIRSTAGLTCYECLGEDQEDCVTHPQNEDNLTLSGEDVYCMTDFATIGSEIDVRRAVVRKREFSEKNLTDVVIAGPWNGTANPERNYLNITYCKTNLCNDHLYVSPPKLKSTIKCYICGNNDENCARNVSSKYLVQVEPIPSWAKSATSEARIVSEPPIGEYMYETYCETRIYTGTDTPIVNRNATWLKKGEMSDGQCRYNGKTEYCYCKSHDGCNNKNGSDIVGKSLSVMFALLILTKLSVSLL